MTRRAAFFDTLRTAGWQFAAVDIGDFTPEGPLDSQAELKLEVLARATALMEYDAVTLGELDFAPGPEHVRRLVGWLGDPVLATNYTLPEGVPTERTRTIFRRNKKIGLVALLDPVLADTVADWLAVEPWDAHTELVNALADTTDLLIALAHVPDTNAVHRLIELFPDVDLVVAGHAGAIPPTLRIQQGVAVVGSANRGRYLGRAEFIFDTGGRGGRLEAYYLPVVKEWGRRPGPDSLMAGYYADMRKLVMSEAFQKEALAALEEPPVRFVGNKACASCHEAETTQWKTTLHSHAQQTLIDVGKDHDPECQVCHTTGFGFETGFATPQTTPHMWEVGCESCHGGGIEHVANPELPYGAVTEANCIGCHTPENSPDYTYDEYLPRIVHSVTGSVGKPRTGHGDHE